jgi:uncharacterized protein (DUF302 family)
MGKNLYQNVRTEVKKNLNRVVEFAGMEYAIRATTPVSVPGAERALREYLADHGFHVIHETDVKAIHEHYDIEYPEFKILKVVRAETFMECPMASTAVDIDPSTGSVLPPGIILYDLDGVTHVSAVRPSTLLAVFRDPDVRDTIVELESFLWDALFEGVPDSEMVSEEPPLRPGEESRRGTFKKRLNLVLSLVDGESSMHFSTDASPEEVKETLRDSLTRRGQRVLGEVAGGDIMLVVNPGQAHKALAIDPDLAVFAPLSVAFSTEGGRTHVRTVRPTTLLIFFTHPEMQDLLMEMEMLLWNALVDGVPGGRVESRQPPLQPEGGQRTIAAGLPGGLGALRKQEALQGEEVDRQKELQR